MKSDKKLDNTKLGILVIEGLLFLVFSLYMIGRNQNILGASMNVYVEIKDVNGLLPGNNVRYKGMNVGTVADIEMQDPELIRVRLLIKKTMAPYILDNSRTTINTDGLMGNKIIHVHPQEGPGNPIEEGVILYPLDQVGTEEMLKKLNDSGDYLERTLMNLAEITERLNENEVLWNLVSDSLLVSEVKGAVRSFTLAGNNAAGMAKAGKELFQEMESGDGLTASLISDTLLTESVERTLAQMELTTQEANEALQQIRLLLQDVQEGQGTVGMLMKDSLFRETLIQTMINLEQSTESFNTNMEAMRSNFLFRKYFKKQEKAQKKAEKVKENSN
ncbi:MlaD family protein [Algoriphagus taiwanensis]|uniref:Mce/MlaD domain-containing protein n=1 Tax=Algoriphagus taiwanensis TaxID=1445656 RepID=A0ABQ6Q2J1_9BACT|nr:hypothetical protein Ataiwa_26660 [Algoriphagus taiwanensis]